jgi:hypothetical protein
VEVVTVSRRTIAKTFGASLVAMVAALVLLAVAGGLAYANGSFVMDGPDVVGVRSTPFGWVMIGLAALAVLTLMGAAVAQFVAWVGAVVHTAQLADKTWFIVLLVLGMFSFGFIAMVIYLLAGPKDPDLPQTPSPAVAEQPKPDLRVPVS